MRWTRCGAPRVGAQRRRRPLLASMRCSQAASVGCPGTTGTAAAPDPMPAPPFYLPTRPHPRQIYFWPGMSEPMVVKISDDERTR